MRALKKASGYNPDVLVLVLFGNDMANAVKLIPKAGFKKKPAIVVPNLTLGMVESAGYANLEGVVGALPWTWKVPFQYGFEKGKVFVNNFKSKFNRFPSTSGASAYTILHEYKAAAERAKSFDADKVVAALEGHKYQLLKDEQIWAKRNRQSLQTVYAVKVKSAEEIKKSELEMDYFDIISSIPKEVAFKGE